MLEALSDHLLQCGLTGSWRAIFVGQRADAVRFQRRSLTLLHSDSPDDSPGDLVVSLIAEQYGGTFQYGSKWPVALSFDEPSAALRAGLTLHRIAQGKRLRTALTCGVCTAAVFDVNGTSRTVLLGEAVAKAAADALTAPAGSIQIAPHTYHLVHAEIGVAARGAVLMTEMRGDEVSSATLTLPPSPCSDLSTFAGLGLT